MSLQQRLTALAQAVGGDVKSLLAAQGSLQALTTSAKSNLVAAVNELKSAVDAAGGGGKLRFREFTASGTFTPPAALIAATKLLLAEVVNACSEPWAASSDLTSPPTA